MVECGGRDWSLEGPDEDNSAKAARWGGRAVEMVAGGPDWLICSLEGAEDEAALDGALLVSVHSDFRRLVCSTISSQTAVTNLAVAPFLIKTSGEKPSCRRPLMTSMYCRASATVIAVAQSQNTECRCGTGINSDSLGDADDNGPGDVLIGGDIAALTPLTSPPDPEAEAV